MIKNKTIAGDIVMTSHPLVFTTELTSTGIQESDINVPAMQYMVLYQQIYNSFWNVLNIKEITDCLQSSIWYPQHLIEQSLSLDR